MGLRDEATIELAQQVLERSTSARVNWESMDKLDAFVYRGSQASVIIRSKDDDNREPFVFELYDANGTLVDSIQSDWVTVDEEGSQEAATQNSILEQLYYSAHRRAFNIDTLAQSIINDIDQAPAPL